MMTMLIMLFGLAAGLCLAYLVDSAYSEAAPVSKPERKCSRCKWHRRCATRAVCLHPDILKKSGHSVPCVLAITDPEMCGVERRLHAPR